MTNYVIYERIMVRKQTVENDLASYGLKVEGDIVTCDEKRSFILPQHAALGLRDYVIARRGRRSAVVGEVRRYADMFGRRNDAA